MLLKTPDGSLQWECPPYIYSALTFYVAALFILIAELLEDNFGEGDDYKCTFSNLREELLMDKYHQELSNQELVRLVTGKEMVDPDQADLEVVINFAALPDDPSSIPYDPILHRVQGAIHGLTAFFWMSQGTYLSPGQVLDITKCLELCKLQLDKVGNIPIQDYFTELHNFLIGVSHQQEGVLVSVDRS